MMRLKFIGSDRFLLDRKNCTPQQGRVLLLLMGNRCVTKEMIADVVWPGVETKPDTFWKQMDVLRWHLRTMLAPGGWAIISRYPNSPRHHWTLVRADEIQLAA